MKFKELSEKWLEQQKLTKRFTSINRYYSIIQWYLLPEFGKKWVTRIKQQQVADFYIKLQTRLTKKTNKPYSPSTLNKIHMVFASIMKYGRFECNIHCIIPKFVPICRNFEEREPTLFFMDNELQKVVRELYKMKGDRNLFTKLGILMSLYHGLRIGEVCGLRWEDIDWENQKMHIRRTVNRVYDVEKKEMVLYVASPKTKKSMRTIPINDSIFQVLLILKARNFYSGYIIRDTFNYDVGNMEIPCSNVTLRKRLSRVLRAANVESHRFHCLRHTFASHAITCGVNPKTVSVILGHASVNFTLDVYVHPTEEEEEECVNVWQVDLEKFFAPVHEEKGFDIKKLEISKAYCMVRKKNQEFMEKMGITEEEEKTVLKAAKYNEIEYLIDEYKIDWKEEEEKIYFPVFTKEGVTL